MSQRSLDQPFVDHMRDLEARIKRLESSKNTAVKQNDIRLSDTLVRADSVNDRLCLENLVTHRIVCIEEAVAAPVAAVIPPCQAVFSFSGPLDGADEGSSSPAYNMEVAATARQIVVARPSGDSFTGTVTICVRFQDASISMTADLDDTDEYSVTEINVPLVEFDDIQCVLVAAATDAENISVFVRFGTPTVALSSTDCAG